MNEKEIDARIQMLEFQRNEAMNRCVLMAGQIAILQEEVKAYAKKDIDGAGAASSNSGTSD